MDDIGLKILYTLNLVAICWVRPLGSSGLVVDAVGVHPVVEVEPCIVGGNGLSKGGRVCVFHPVTVHTNHEWFHRSAHGAIGSARRSVRRGDTVKLSPTIPVIRLPSGDNSWRRWGTSPAWDCDVVIVAPLSPPGSSDSNSVANS